LLYWESQLLILFGIRGGLLFQRFMRYFCDLVNGDTDAPDDVVKSSVIQTVQ
jgi:hypothetical protein